MIGNARRSSPNDQHFSIVRELSFTQGTVATSNEVQTNGDG